MNAKAKETNVLNNYRNADPEGRFSLLMDNFASFPRLICIEERKTRYKLKAEREFLKSHTRDELGVRVQTSHIGDPTVDEAVSEVSLQEAFVTGEVNRELFKGMEDALEYEMQIRMISTMRMDYELLVDIIDCLDHDDSKIIKQYLLGGKYIKEIALDEDRSYEAMKKRIARIRSNIRDEILECLEIGCKGV